MANPNIVNVSTINGITDIQELNTTYTTGLVANSASSGKVYKINRDKIKNAKSLNLSIGNWISFKGLSTITVVIVVSKTDEM